MEGVEGRGVRCVELCRGWSCEMCEVCRGCEMCGGV